MAETKLDQESIQDSALSSKDRENRMELVIVLILAWIFIPLDWLLLAGALISFFCSQPGWGFLLLVLAFWARPEKK